ncbi:MAG: restriction endonuclease subunit S, partial [Methanosarcinaceae archaeon]|nr:restriction endonuclease subunit S [Methanosarcinaceae archaeon]
MASSWQRSTLDEAIEIISGGTPKTIVAEYWGGEINWLSVADFNTGYRWISSAEKSITERGLAESATSLLNRRDIIISARGTVGVIAQLAKPMAFNQSCYGIRGKDGISDTDFIYYALGQAVAKMKQVAHGGVFDTITRDTFKIINIDLPSLPEQRAIAHILGTLDDKIELNRRINETLETMARALFKSWFVDFDPVRAKAEGRPTGLPKHIADLFPDSFENSELGDIPKGWKTSDIGFIAEVIDCLHSKKPERRDSGKPFLQLINIRDDGLIDMKDTYFIDEDDYREWVSRMEASPGDCVITNVGRVGAVAQIPVGLKAALGRNMTGVRCKSSFPFPTFLIECLLSQAMKDEIIQKMDSGTILDALNVRNIPKLRFTIPSETIANFFEEKVR